MLSLNLNSNLYDFTNRFAFAQSLLSKRFNQEEMSRSFFIYAANRHQHLLTWNAILNFEKKFTHL